MKEKMHVESSLANSRIASFFTVPASIDRITSQLQLFGWEGVTVKNITQHIATAPTGSVLQPIVNTLYGTANGHEVAFSFKKEDNKIFIMA